jgi:LysM repeat protein
MERAGDVMGRAGRPHRWRWARVPAVVAGLMLVERALVGAVGAPVQQLRALGSVAGAVPADPVTPLLAALALLAEALIGYGLLVLVLRSLCALPGSVGRLAGRVALLVSPVAVRRLLDLVVGGTLLAQATLATMPEPPSPGPRPGAVHLTLASPRTPAAAVVAVTRSGSPVRESAPVREPAPVEARPTPRRSAAPLPPWLGGGPSTPTPGYTVEAGDTLWGIAAARLPTAERSLAGVHRHWQRIYRANRAVIGADPDLIRPGTRLEVPRARHDRP